MEYLCELGAGQRVYLENGRNQTRVTIASSSSGQQQQTSSSFQTGDWTAPPAVFQGANEFVVKLYTAQGDRFVSIQGNHLSAMNEAPALTEAQALQVQPMPLMPVASMPPMQPMSPLKPLPPMQPMTMGKMQMDREAMSMQMGDMRMSLNPMERSKRNPSQTRASEATETTEGERKFCSQCGVAMKPSDRFCASCGHRLD